jgi:hypothetical protein
MSWNIFKELKARKMMREPSSDVRAFRDTWPTAEFVRSRHGLSVRSQYETDHMLVMGCILRTSKRDPYRWI